MTWLWVILAVGVIGYLIAYFSSDGDTGEAVEAGIGAAMGCGSVIFHIFLTVVSLAAIIWLFGWLFGGCN